MRQIVMVLALSLMVVCAGAATGEAPRQIPPTVWYQGFLADVSTDEPINGTVDIVVRLYTLPAGGTVVWGPETHAGTTVTEGWFNIELGSALPLPDFDGPALHLDLRVDGEVMSQRMKLGSVPAAFQAAHADSASAGAGGTSLWSEAGGDVYRLTGEVGIGVASPTQDLHIKRDQNGMTGIKIENTDTGASSSERIDFVNEDGSIAFISLYDDDHGSYPGRMMIANNRADGTMWLVTNTGVLFIDAAGDVGIGTTYPAATLDVDGTARVEGVEMATGASDGYVLTSDATGVGTWQAVPASADSDWTVDGDNMYAAVAGSLGIGTSSPAGHVHVSAAGHDNSIFESTGIGGSVELIALTSAGGVYDDLKISKHGPSASGSTAGIALAGLGRVSSGTMATGLMLQAKGDTPMYFTSGDTVRMRIDSVGTVNILDVLHLEPTSVIPTSPSNGDMIVYGTVPSQGLYIYINDFWELLVGSVKEDPNHPADAVER